MRRILVFLATMVMGVLVASGVALAAVVPEVEPNDSIPAGAQAIAATSFDLTENADIHNSTTVPHATVNGMGDNTIDYYSFTVPAGGSEQVTLDIDHTTSDEAADVFYDSWIELYNSSGERLTFNDDASGDPGSTPEGDDPGGRDSFIATTLDPGTYYVGVGRFQCVFISEDVCIAQMLAVPATATYQLHVSVGNPPTADTTPPSVEVSPANLETGLAPTANVTATFSEQVQGVTKSTFKLERVVVNKRGVEQFKRVRAQVSTLVNGTGADAVTVATLDPAKDLQSGSYRVSITNGVTDMAGNPLDPWTSRFTVGSPPV